MIDFLYVAILIAFFGTMMLLVRACEVMVGRDDGGAVDRGEQHPADPGRSGDTERGSAHTPGSSEVAA